MHQPTEPWTPSKDIRRLVAWISKYRAPLRSIASLFGSNITNAVLSAIGGLLVARFLAPDITGSFRAYTIPLTYLIFLHLGTWDGLWRQIPYYIGKGIPDQADGIASTAGAYNIFLSIVVSCGFLCCATYSLIQHDMHGALGWIAQSIYCWGIFYNNYLTSTYRTLNHFVTMARIQTTQSILSFGMVFLLPFLGFNGLCLRYALPSILALWLFHRFRPLKIRYRFDFQTFKDLIKIGFPFSFWGNLYTSIWYATESALVLSLNGISALGLFSVAVVLRGAANTLPDAIWQVLTPRVVTSLAREGSIHQPNKRIAWVTICLTGSMMLFAWVVSYLLALLVPLVIPKYAAGIPVMKLCLWFPVVQAAFLPLNTLFAAGRPWLYGRSVLAGIIVFPLAAYLLTPFMGGLLAVAAGSLLGRAVRTLLAYGDLIALTRRESKGLASL